MSFNASGIFDKLAERDRIKNRYREARKLIDYWIDRYYRNKIKWAERKISTEKENLLDNLFFTSDCRRL